ncbi:YifB family Mg chelatase-like AAA ATPase [Desulfococcus sp.]|uniref:YifB family Mg chelatase-like AAA ATPase n=1 Tax=Desulfococcus sp. TaxID=2025834 RepID=UPI0035936799
MLSKVSSGAVIGIDAYVVEVEVDISAGLPSFTTVGLPEASVKESKERVKAAIQNSGYAFPDDRITINLAPADIKKEGTGLDLPIALGILAALGLIPKDVLADYMIMGELSLDGRVKPVRGALPAALTALRAGYRGIMVPRDNSREAAVVREISVLPVTHLAQVVDFYRGLAAIPPVEANLDEVFSESEHYGDDFSDVMGQEHVKRALEVAAAGAHNLMMIGPPGSGKTMLARRIPSILPPMTFDESIETTRIYSVVGGLEKDQALVVRRPFRSPHHTISDAGLIGGGRIPRPGEVSLAHNGVLFLDELPEFKKNVLEVLRQPLEDLSVTISRVNSSLTYPAAFMLISAMNPCPCGYQGDAAHECRCSPSQIDRYRSRISGPLLDRIDIHVEVPAVPYQELAAGTPAESSPAIRRRVSAARTLQTRRFSRANIHCNAQMGSRHIRKHCAIDKASADLLATAVSRLGLSARAYNRILKISRTIADLDGSETVRIDHLSEAIQYRSLDRRGRP